MHDKHVDDPVVDENLPDEHNKQTLLDVAPMVVEYLPIEHLTQDEDPVVFENEPEAHWVHVDDPVVDENLPAWHLIHVDEFIDDE